MNQDPSSYRPELDSFRALAITVVLLHHYIQDRSFVLSGFGVMLFFVLSGYFGTRSLLTLKELVDAGSVTVSAALKTFYGRRYLRIVPVHLLVLALTALVDVPFARSAFWWNAPFLANVGMIWRDEWFGPFSPLWSLAALEQFYLWWPLALLWVRRQRLFLLIALTIASASAWTLVCWSLSLGELYWTVTSVGVFDQVGFGALLALVRAEPSYHGLRTLLRERVAGPCGVILLALVGARMAGISAPFEVFWISFVGCLLFVWLIDRGLRGVHGVAGALLRNPTIAAAGRVSYSAFLLHNFTELLVPRVGFLAGILDSDWRSVVLIPLTFALSHAVWLHIELPIARFRQTRFRLHSASLPATERLVGAGS